MPLNACMHVGVCVWEDGWDIWTIMVMCIWITNMFYVNKNNLLIFRPAELIRYLLCWSKWFSNNFHPNPSSVITSPQASKDKVDLAFYNFKEVFTPDWNRLETHFIFWQTQTQTILRCILTKPIHLNSSQKNNLWVC